MTLEEAAELYPIGAICEDIYSMRGNATVEVIDAASNIKSHWVSEGGRIYKSAFQYGMSKRILIAVKLLDNPSPVKIDGYTIDKHIGKILKYPKGYKPANMMYTILENGQWGYLPIT